MELSKFEEDLGLRGLHGMVNVTAHIWDDVRRFHVHIVHCSVKQLHTALQKRTRFSVQSALSLAEQGSSKGLVALCYRAKMSAQKGQTIGTKGCCTLGVLKA